MGIRQGEPEWKHQVNDALRELQPEIDRILDEYGVPRLDQQGRLWAHGHRRRRASSSRRRAAEPSADGGTAEVPEPAAYRMDKYRAPTPATLQGATVLDTARVAEADRRAAAGARRRAGAARKPPGRTQGQLWIEPKRLDIPGSVWLPNTGFGELPPETASWFAAGSERLTGGDKARPIVFYCERQCWMSWNAARRPDRARLHRGQLVPRRRPGLARRRARTRARQARAVAGRSADRHQLSPPHRRASGDRPMPFRVACLLLLLLAPAGAASPGHDEPCRPRLAAHERGRADARRRQRR